MRATLHDASRMSVLLDAQRILKNKMSVIDFVQIVEQFPCIYNSDLPDYARKDTTEKAWQKVANEIEWTVTECKEKWKNIRNGYVRSLKPAANGVAKKPYYLCDAMSFVLPYINPATNIHADRRLQTPKSETTRSESRSDNEERSDDEYKAEEIEVEVEPQAVRRQFKKKRMMKKTDDVDRAFVSWLQNKKARVEDPKKMFLLSLLPDVKNLTDKQLGVFRIKVLLLLEEVKSQSGSGLQGLLDQCRNVTNSTD